MAETSDRLTAALSGRYAIEREVGAGGMATVYLARDLRHDRKVALKVLRPDLAAVVGAERFLAEIRTTANLQHAHILPLFDSGSAEGLVYFVMPYVAGESLRDRLDREQQLPVDEAVRIASEIADALHYAHRQGIVHRDIKPANVLLQEGRVLVADFGIALAVSRAEGGRLTETGLSLGTPHYMSPEQASGERTLDPRADVYALGCVLYEMLTGQPPHTGASAQVVLAKILTETARPVTDVRRSVPAHIDAAVARAIERLPADRFSSAEAFAAALATGRNAEMFLSRARGRGTWAGVRRAPLTVGAAMIALLAAGALGVIYAQRPTPEPLWLTIPPPHGAFALDPGAALSPDGRRVVFEAPDAADETQLWVRDLASQTARPLPGTAEGGNAFWSPDGSSVGFFAKGKLMRVDLDGGMPQTLADAVNARGGTWGVTDEILYVAPIGTLQVIPASGGAPRRLSIDLPGAEAGLIISWPHFLPDGRHFLVYGSRVEDDAHDGVYVASIDEENPRFLFPSLSRAEYAGGHILFGQEGALFARAFDLGDLEVTGDPVRLAEGLGISGGNLAHVPFSASEQRVLIWSGRFNVDTQLAWYDRGGNRLGALGPVGPYFSLALSPDEERVLIERFADPTEIWTVDLTTGVPTLFGTGSTPVWMPDGSGVAHMRGNSSSAILLRSTSGTGIDTVSNPSGKPRWLTGVSPDGRTLFYDESSPETAYDIGALALSDPSTARSYLATRVAENQAELSTNGAWMAYVSNETDEAEVYVQSYPEPSKKGRVSTAGGRWPRWSPDGRTLYFIDSTNVLIAAGVAEGPLGFAFTPRPLFQAPLTSLDFMRDQWVPTRSGERFLFLERVESDVPPTLQVGLNWQAGLER